MNDLIGIIAVAIALVSYALYIASTVSGRSSPHAISWGIWSVLSGFVFFEQLANDAGPGAWVTASAALGNGVIFLLALWKGEKSIHKLDWLCLGFVALLLVFWQEVTDPTTTIGFAVAIVLLGFLPTIRKVHNSPYGESIWSFILNSLKFVVAFAALQTITLATALYPAALGVINVGFATYLIVRRKQIAHRKPASKRKQKHRR